MDYIELDLNLLQTFTVVYKYKSIKLASEKLFISQPAVSVNIKKLEEFLNGKLFIRTPKGVTPTQEGEIFYQHVIEGLKHFKNGINHFSNILKNYSGNIKIGARSTVTRHLLLPFINKFGEKYPNINISLTDALSSYLVEFLNKGELDIAIVSTPLENADNFKVTPISKVHDCFVAPYNFPKDTLNKNELQNYPLAAYKHPAKNRVYFDQICKEQNLKIQPKYEMFSSGLIIDFVKQANVIGFTVKEFNQKEIDSKTIKILETDINLQPRNIVAITLKNSVATFACNLFLKEMAEYFNAEKTSK